MITFEGGGILYYIYCIVRHGFDFFKVPRFEPHPPLRPSGEKNVSGAPDYGAHLTFSILMCTPTNKTFFFFGRGG